jgi:hypothetical protein
MTVPGSGRNDVVVVGGADADAKARVFTGITSVEQAMEIAARESALAAGELRTAEEKIGVIQREIVTDPTRAVDAYLLERSRCHVTEALDLELADLPGREQIRLVDEYHRYSTLGSALLFSGTEFDGSSRFVPVPWANLKWWPFKFNDKTSSLACWGDLNIFFEHHWYSGRRLYVFGPYAQIEDLGGAGFDFDNTITSKW